MNEITITQNTHPLYNNGFLSVGEIQYIYSSKKGTISLIELPNYFGDNITLWEIYQKQGKKIFEDVERFYSKDEADKKIREYLS